MISRLNQINRHLSRAAFQRSPSPLAVIRPTLKMGSAEDRSRRTIHTAGCIIIGDEVLGGKTTDTNSSYMAKFCFGLGMTLKRIEVIPDDEDDIVEATRRMSQAYDFVVTSGGIGPTHDDITYQSIAKAFDLPLVEHEKSFARMKRLSKPHASQPNFSWDAPSPALDAKKRMIKLPLDESRAEEGQVLFVKDDLWVPISVVNGNIHILPGVPRLFTSLLDGLKPLLLPRLTDPEGKGIYRIMISTPMAESAVAPYLTELSAKVASKEVKIGSYPRWGKKRNTVTLVGRDSAYMDSLVSEVEEQVKGVRVDNEADADEPDDPKE